jgi:GNAT superfamily N-acetyltransferase
VSRAVARLCEPNDAVRELVELVMRDGGPWAREQPLSFDASSGASWSVVEDEGRLVSACSILPREFVVDGESLRVGLVGSVVTRASHRGKGLAASVLACAESELARRGCLVAALWAEDPEYYAQRGWRPWGSEIDFVLPRELVAHLPDPTGVRLAQASDATAIHRLYAMQRRRVARSRDQTRKLLAIPGMDVLVRERQGEVVAYSCLGRGGDLQEVVHEWSGAVQDVLALLRMHLDLRTTLGDHRDLFLMCADEPDHPLVAALEDLGAPASRGILGMAKIVDPAAACAAIARRHGRAGRKLSWREHRSIDLPELSQGACEFELGAKRCVLAAAELLELLAAPRGSQAVARTFAARLGLEPVPPMRPFAWGLDSI